MDSTSSKPILLISPMPPPFGGIATWTRMVFEHGLPDQNPLSLVNTRLRGKRNIFDKAGISFSEFIRTLQIICNLVYQLTTNRPKLIHLSCALSATGVMRDWLCVRIAKLFGVPAVCQYHGNLPDFDERRFLGLSGAALRALMQSARVNILTNAISLQQAKAAGYGPQLLLLPNFVEEQLFDYQKIPHASTRCQAIYAGGITRKKGCADLLELARQTPAVDYHLYGKMHADMAASFQKVPANIFVHGVVSHDDLLQAMCGSDVLLFPSHSEGFPLTVLEAMTIGLPVIATKVGAIPEMIEAEGGYLVECGDIDGLTQAMQRLQDDAALRKQMGAFNRAKCDQQYRYSIVMRQLQQIYEQIQPCAE